MERFSVYTESFSVQTENHSMKFIPLCWYVFVGEYECTKHINNKKPQIQIVSKKNDIVVENNIVKEKVMTTSEKIAMAQNVLNDKEHSAPVKRVKKDKGLIERTESSKTVLTEDNKELLND